MPLTGPQIKILREAIIAAFQEEEELEMLLEDELNERFADIRKGKKYSSIVQNFIKWADKQGRLREAVIGASRANPGNPALRAAISHLFDVLLERPDFLPINVIATLKTLQIFPGIAKCCRSTLPNAETYRFDILQSIENDQLSVDARWLMVLDLLFHAYPKQQNIPSILIFVDHLCQQPEVPAENREVLKRWLLPAAAQHNYQLLKPLSEEDTGSYTQGGTMLQGYLLIIVQKMNKSSLRIHGFLVVKTVEQDDFTQSQLIPIAGLSSSQLEQTQRDIGRFQKGTICTFKKLQEEVPVWVRRAKEQLSEQARKLSCSYDDLTVEFFLPYEHLAIDVDLWRVKSVIARRGRLEPLGKKHRVVVRSSDRLDDPDLLNDLKRVWLRTEQFLKTQPTLEEIRAKCEQMPHLSLCQWEKLIPRWRNCLALKLTTGIPDKQQEDLFAALLEAGVPIALWTRRGDLANVNTNQEFDSFLDLECLCNLDKLLEQIRQKRENAHIEETPCEHLGYHLGILCDEPKRLERLNQFGIENSLWG